jgi:hypothetical protein
MGKVLSFSLLFLHFATGSDTLSPCKAPLNQLSSCL